MSSEYVSCVAAILFPIVPGFAELAIIQQGLDSVPVVAFLFFFWRRDDFNHTLMKPLFPGEDFSHSAIGFGIVAGRTTGLNGGEFFGPRAGPQ